MKQFICGLLLLTLVACGQQTAEQKAEHQEAESKDAELSFSVADEATLDKLLAQYAPYQMHYDASGLPAQDVELLKTLVEAAQLVDHIYWLQTSEAGMKYREVLQKHQDNPRYRKALTLLNRNAGPHDQLQNNQAFIGDEAFFPGGELYPDGMTAEDFDSYLAGLDEEARKPFMDPYTVIRKDGDGYKAVPYHEAWATEIGELAGLLRKAAGLTDHEGLKNYLNLKAKAVETDDYYEADCAWIDMDNPPYDFLVGPFETYADGIKGIKAKYEALVEVVDKEESAKLDVYKKYLQQMENNLPVDDVYKSKVEGLTAKFRIVHDAYRAGEAVYGYQAVATNLPNDPKVHATKGTVKTFWKNMFKARFEEIIRPVGSKLIAEDQVDKMSFDGFFQFVVMHEICHAVGPRTVKVGPNKDMAVNAAIGPNYNGLEECKADITGLLSLAFLMDEGVVPADMEEAFYVSYLGSLFRTIRFGTGQAHGKAATISLNYLLDQGALSYDAEQVRWRINHDKFRGGVAALSKDLLVLLGDGDKEKVQAFYDRWMVVTPELQASLDKVNDLPTDVMPSYDITWP